MLVGSAADQASVDKIVSQSRVMLATAGPFIQIGTPVVDSCVRHGSHYVDITGEVPWVRQLVDKYDAAAKDKGVYIVNCCGFDSVPSDLGTLFTTRAIRRRFHQPTRRVRNFADMAGQLSGGTASTGIVLEQMGKEVLAQLQDPFLLGGAPPGGPRPEDMDQREAVFVPELDSWTAPFMMASINTRIVRRSHQLYSEAGQAYSADFSYNECALAASEKKAQSMARPMPPAAKRLEMVEKGVLPKPGEGPSEELRAKSWFKMTLVGEAEDGQQLVTTVSGGDPGWRGGGRRGVGVGVVGGR